MRQAIHIELIILIILIFGLSLWLPSCSSGRSIKRANTASEGQRNPSGRGGHDHDSVGGGLDDSVGALPVPEREDEPPEPSPQAKGAEPSAHVGAELPSDLEPPPAPADAPPAPAPAAAPPAPAPAAAPPASSFVLEKTSLRDEEESEPTLQLSTSRAGSGAGSGAGGGAVYRKGSSVVASKNAQRKKRRSKRSSKSPSLKVSPTAEPLENKTGATTSYTIGGVRLPNMIRAQLNENHLPRASMSKADAQEELRRVDLTAEPLRLIPAPSARCAPVERINELLSFSLTEQLSLWGVNSTLSGFMRDKEAQLQQRLKASQRSEAHLQVRLTGVGGGWLCSQSDHVKVEGAIEVSVGPERVIFTGKSSHELKIPEGALFSRFDSAVRELVGAWRDALASPLRRCLKLAAVRHAKGKVRLKSKPHSAQGTLDAQCLVK